ncbi:MAG: hypothetical protein ACOCUG_02480 [Halanaerobium sp.]
MIAAVLLAVATDCISINKLSSFFEKSEPIPRLERGTMKRESWLAAAISLLILAAAVFREAYMIFQI